jgi:hypothetical protein
LQWEEAGSATYMVWKKVQQLTRVDVQTGYSGF